MSGVLLFARLFLALVFGISGVAKAADPAGSRRAVVDFGIPEALATPLAWILPAVELVIAVALIPTDTAWPGAVAASALLLIFSIAITINLIRGRSSECHCFGQLHSERVTSKTLARNLVLLVLAGLVVVEGRTNPGPSAVSWLAQIRAVEAVYLVLGASSVALLIASVVYLRQVLSRQSTIITTIEAMKKVIDEDYAEAPIEHAEATEPTEGLPVGSPAPSFSLPSIGGKQVALKDLLSHGKSVLLLFVSPNCVPCESVLSAVKDWQREYKSELTIVLLSKGSLDDNRERMSKYDAQNLLLLGETSVTDHYRSKWT